MARPVVEMCPGNDWIPPDSDVIFAIRNLRFTLLRLVASKIFICGNLRHFYARHFPIEPTHAIAANNKIRGIENAALHESSTARRTAMRLKLAFCSANHGKTSRKCYRCRQRIMRSGRDKPPGNS
jgi:hypothetical protein